jgi:hypothetical protein
MMIIMLEPFWDEKQTGVLIDDWGGGLTIFVFYFIRDSWYLSRIGILAMNSGMMMTGMVKGPKAQEPAFLKIFGGQHG